MKVLPFIKMHGIGNDYVYIDCFQKSTADLLAQSKFADLACSVSDRHFGVGSDGIVLIMPSEEADAEMRIFNADGSEAEMCGNAIRCVGKYLYENGICPHLRLHIMTKAGVRELSLHVKNNIVEQVTVNMGKAKISPDSLSLNERDILGFSSVNIGNPHAVFFRDWVISDAEMNSLGGRIGTHPYFHGGINVEFVHVRNAHELDVRVWERGTGETLACGTGACAAAVAAYKLGETEQEMVVHLRGGDLFIQYDPLDKIVTMTGSATEVFRGQFIL